MLFSYHAASGNIALCLGDGRVQFWHYLTDSALLQAPLPSHTIAHERIKAAQKQAQYIQASLEKVDGNLRYRVTREKELKSSISELDTKRTHFWHVICIIISY